MGGVEVEVVMTFIMEIEIRCEYCDRSGRFSGMTVAQARKELKQEGWSSKGGLDYCPQCSQITKMHKRKRS
jgi:hypothetical protein